MSDNTYTCARCGKTYEKEWSDEEALKETKVNFGVKYEKHECDVICDDCYKINMKQ